MVYRIEIGLRENLPDPQGLKLLKRIRNDFGLELEKVRCLDVYTINADLSREQVEHLAREAYCDPVIQQYAIDRPLPGACDWAVEVSFRPGVTDNVGRTAAEALELLLGRRLDPKEGVYTARQVRFSGSIENKQVEEIGRKLLANELIQKVRILSGAELAQKGFSPEVPRVAGRGRPPVQIISLDLDDQKLMELSRQRVLALTLPEMHSIRDYYLRDDVRRERKDLGLPPWPTDVELEALAQTWSEHCKHKIFNARIFFQGQDGHKQTIDSLFNTYIRGATEKVRKEKGNRDLCLSVFRDNAGVVKFNESWSLAFKVETHNSPSALDPYGGALTGIVGVNRDPFGTGMGARLIFNTDVFCLADPFYKDPLPPGLLHPRRILEGVREGVEHGGNKSGIPTINGSLVFDNRYLGKPLVYCGTAGLLPARVAGRPGHEKRARPGDRIVKVGGRIGKDGIHGATFSSEELHEGSPATAVQIGDPITQKRMTDFLLRARDLGLYNCITDDGAGGLSSSVGEMAEEPGGCELDLTHAPLKYEGLAPWEILLSEAQERMTVAVPPEKLDQFLALARRYQVEATDLGQFTSSGYFRVFDNGKCVASLQMDFLHHGLPRMELEAREEKPPYHEPAVPVPEQHGKLLKQMLGRLNVCSKAYWVRQYDHEVQAGTVIKPLCGASGNGPSDAAVFRPLLDSMQAVVVAHGIAPRYGDLDAYAMGTCAFDEAVRNAVASGADPDRMAALDNFCWCDPIKSDRNPDGDVKLGKLVRTCQGLYDACLAYGIPLVSGKDSMKNDAIIGDKRISTPPTLLVSLLGLMDDARLAVSMDLKRPGNLLYLLGLTRKELGASEYFLHLGLGGGQPPQVDFSANRGLYRRLHQAMEAGLVRSAHDCSDGGLGVCLAEMCIGGELGAKLELGSVKHQDCGRDDLLLYSESTGRLLVEVEKKDRERFETMFKGTVFSCVGQVSENRRLVVIGLQGGVIIDEAIADLFHAWQRPLDF